MWQRAEWKSGLKWMLWILEFFEAGKAQANFSYEIFLQFSISRKRGMFSIYRTFWCTLASFSNLFFPKAVRCFFTISTIGSSPHLTSLISFLPSSHILTIFLLPSLFYSPFCSKTWSLKANWSWIREIVVVTSYNNAVLFGRRKSSVGRRCLKVEEIY